jgi:hypothetical protein
MSEVRPLKDLYKILLFAVKKELKCNYGVCEILTRLEKNHLISKEELTLLRINFAKNKPSTKHHLQFYISPYFKKGLKYAYWWNVGTNGDEERVKFVEYLIENHIP